MRSPAGLADFAGYGLAWPDKPQARAAAFAPCTGQLVERRSDSVDWATTANVLIEGDNLPALKLLGPLLPDAVKLAYLDPPYNLGGDVTYDDNFGRAHTDWLTMMYPRLIRTRELLRADGVICISIDDAEVARLRLLCDEVFGPQNFLATFVWETKRAARGVPPKSLLMHNHEYIVCYARDRASVRLRGLERNDADFVNPDGDPRGPWRSESMKATGSQHNYFTITDPASGIEYHANWAFSPAALARMITDERVLFPPHPQGTPRQKKFRDTYTNDTKAAVTSLGWHSTERATKALMELFGGTKVFSFPKPLSVLEFLCGQLVGPGETVLDLFAGSGTTGHAVLNLNAADQGGRRFVLIQAPEPLDADNRQQRSAALFCDQLACPRTIVELTKERLRRAGARVRGDAPEASGTAELDVGFRVYELQHD